MFYALILTLALILLSMQGNENSAPLSQKSFSNETQNDICPLFLDENIKPYVNQLKERIKIDLKGKVPEDYIEMIFCRKDLVFYPDRMLRSLTWSEAKLPYHQFLEVERLYRAKKFLEEEAPLLSQIEEKFQVDKEVIVAIFLVETDLGRKTGQHSVLNTFFSLALAGYEDLFKKYLIDKPEIDFNNETVRNRWERRARWGYGELLNFLEICYKNQIDPFALKGSIFGAFGFPQFVPRSYILYGYDWDGDGRVDLFSKEDALASIANYLQKEGYQRNRDREFKKRIIMKYNKSEPYAETVLSIAEALKKNWFTKENAQN